MLLGPIFSFEMLTSSRRTRYFVVRGLYGVVLAVALMIVWVSVFWEPYGTNRGNAIALSADFMAGFFGTFSLMQLLAAVILGPAVAAGTISGERERRTIEYLFAANVGNAEIVLSKLAARFLHIMLILLAGLPILAVAMLQGGIAPEALLAVYVVVFSTVVTVAAFSIAVSVWSARARDAVIRAYLLLLVLLIVPPVMTGIALTGSLNASWYDVLLEFAIEPMLVANPFWNLSTIISGTSAAAMSTGWSAVGSLVRNQLIFAVVCGVYATLSVRRVHIRQMGRSRESRGLRLLRLPRLRPGLGADPMFWKEFFAAEASSRLGAVGRIAIFLLAACALVPLVWEFLQTISSQTSGQGPRGIPFNVRDYLGMTAGFGSLIACGIFVLVAARSACSITSEKERDCWPSLMSTPLEGAEIVRAKVFGSIYSFRYLYGILFVMWAMAVYVSPVFAIVVPFLLLTVTVISISVSSLGVLLSMKMKSSLWSMAATLGISFFVGGGYLCCCFPLFFGRGGNGIEIVLAPCMPFLMAIPIILYAHGTTGPDLGGIVAAYVLGMIGYSVSAALLFASALASFDGLSGRIDEMHLGQVDYFPLGKSPFSESGGDGALESGTLENGALENGALENVAPESSP